MEKAAGVSLHEVHRVQKSTFFAKFDIFLVNLPYSATFDPPKNPTFSGFSGKFSGKISGNFRKVDQLGQIYLSPRHFGGSGGPFLSDFVDIFPKKSVTFFKFTFLHGVFRGCRGPKMEHLGDIVDQKGWLIRLFTALFYFFGGKKVSLW